MHRSSSLTGPAFHAGPEVGKGRDLAKCWYRAGCAVRSSGGASTASISSHDPSATGNAGDPRHGGSGGRATGCRAAPVTLGPCAQLFTGTTGYTRIQRLVYGIQAPSLAVKKPLSDSLSRSISPGFCGQGWRAGGRATMRRSRRSSARHDEETSPRLTGLSLSNAPAAEAFKTRPSPFLKSHLHQVLPPTPDGGMA